MDLGEPSPVVGRGGLGFVDKVQIQEEIAGWVQSFK